METDFGVIQVLVTVGALITTILLSRLFRLEIERDLGLGILRSGIQLALIGYVLRYLLGSEHFVVPVVIVIAMILIGAQTASRRAAPRRLALPGAAIAIAAGGVTSILLLIAVGVIPVSAETGLPELRYLIPLAGILVGASMQSASQAFERFSAEMQHDQTLVEAALTEGATPWQAVKRTAGTSIRAGLISPIDRLKVMGTVVLPGATVGMIIAGADPLQAVYLQMIVAYMLLFSRSITVALAIFLLHPLYFDRQGHLRTQYLMP
jgi:putative ABC transport system permease protein